MGWRVDGCVWGRVLHTERQVGSVQEWKGYTCWLSDGSWLTATQVISWSCWLSDGSWFTGTQVIMRIVWWFTGTQVITRIIWWFTGTQVIVRVVTLYGRLASYSLREVTRLQNQSKQKKREKIEKEFCEKTAGGVTFRIAQACTRYEEGT